MYSQKNFKNELKVLIDIFFNTIKITDETQSVGSLVY